MIKTKKSAVEKSKALLVAKDKTERKKLLKQLNSYTGDFAEVVAALKPKLPAKPQTGLIKDAPFKTPEFAEKYSGEVLHYFVPEDYSKNKPKGLLIFLHGGGKGTPRHAGSMNLQDELSLANIFHASGRIVCYPCAPFNRAAFASWNLPEVDEYLMDVIDELQNLYNIDPNDIILGGFSMGAQGAYHISQRMPDRFGSIMAAAGAWDLACWPCVTGTPLWLWQGVNDAVLFKRRHGTDIEFARLARKRLEECGVEYYYREHAGLHHPACDLPFFRKWMEWAKTRRRDPYFPKVCAATPRGMSPYMDWRRHKESPAASQNHIDFHELAPSPHMRWVSIHDTGEDTVIFDALKMSDCNDESESDWNKFTLTLGRKHIPAGIVEAEIWNRNLIYVNPVNVTGLTLWLHPDMVDFNNLEIFVKGEKRFSGSLKPQLGTLLESYERRRDWGMLYSAKIEFEATETWPAKDQLKLIQV